MPKKKVNLSIKRGEKSKAEDHPTNTQEDTNTHKDIEDKERKRQTHRETQRKEPSRKRKHEH